MTKEKYRTMKCNILEHVITNQCFVHCNATCCSEGNTNGHFYIMHYLYLGIHIKCHVFKICQTIYIITINRGHHSNSASAHGIGYSIGLIIIGQQILLLSLMDVLQTCIYVLIIDLLIMMLYPLSCNMKDCITVL